MDVPERMQYSVSTRLGIRKSSKGRPFMLILSLTYLKSNEEVDRHVEPHMAWVAEGYAKGWFLASGRKVPRTGGVILARGDRAAMESHIAADPFVVHGVASYEITEIALTTVVAGLEGLKA
jgi:uncharacterized protein YciI